jgi:hypothetical protein
VSTLFEREEVDERFENRSRLVPFYANIDRARFA